MRSGASHEKPAPTIDESNTEMGFVERAKVCWSKVTPIEWLGKVKRVADQVTHHIGSRGKSLCAIPNRLLVLFQLNSPLRECRATRLDRNAQIPGVSTRSQQQ